MWTRPPRDYSGYVCSLYSLYTVCDCRLSIPLFSLLSVTVVYRLTLYDCSLVYHVCLFVRLSVCVYHTSQNQLATMCFAAGLPCAAVYGTRMLCAAVLAGPQSSSMIAYYVRSLCSVVVCCCLVRFVYYGCFVSALCSLIILFVCLYVAASGDGAARGPLCRCGTIRCGSLKIAEHVFGAQSLRVASVYASLSVCLFVVNVCLSVFLCAMQTVIRSAGGSVYRTSCGVRPMKTLRARRGCWPRCAVSKIRVTCRCVRVAHLHIGILVPFYTAHTLYADTISLT